MRDLDPDMPAVRAGGDPTAMRASDVDREATAELLRRHHLEGRLDTEELQERLERCLGAKTLTELDLVLVDLPRDRPVQSAAWRSRWLRSRARRLALVAPLVASLIVISAVTGERVFFPAIPLTLFALRPFAPWGWRGGYRPGRPPHGTGVLGRRPT